MEYQYGKKWAKRNELLTRSATNANSTVAEGDAPKNSIKNQVLSIKKEIIFLLLTSLYLILFLYP